MKMKKIRASREQVLSWILIIGGLIGLIAAFIITIEKLSLLQNAAYQPSCNLDPIISCGSVMKSAQSHIFGFPNPLIGLIAFPIVITTGVVLASGVKLKRWYMIGLQLGTIFGLAFVHWLFFQSTYRINALCPYCIAAWIVTITIFWYTLQYNLRQKFITVPRALQKISSFIQAHHLDILVVWFLVLLFFILKHFWYYYGPLWGFVT